LALVLIFLLYPLSRTVPLPPQAARIIDWTFAVVAVVAALYLPFNIDAYKIRPTRPTAQELALGGALMLLILEATRRTIGWHLPAIAVAFLVYCYFGPWMPEPFDHRGFSVTRIIGQSYLTFEGIFSTPLDVAATFIILFTIYGAVLDRGGAGRFFVDWALAVFGREAGPGAPGRAVNAAGFLLGTVSGSGVATTVTVASLTWPLLRRAGYDPDTAGGMISAAGIGATLSPPTLGAAAFIIAEYLDVPYFTILIYATIPTLLYYLSCWLMTEADARRLKIHPTARSDLSVVGLTLSQGYHFISLAAIAVILALGFTSFMAVFWSLAIAFVLSMLREDSRLVSLPAFGFGVGCGIAALIIGRLDPGILPFQLLDARSSVAVFWGIAGATAFSAFQALTALRQDHSPPADQTRMIEALSEGARATLGVVATCATAGIIVCVVNLTGLGLTISGIIVEFGQGSRLAVILLAALAMWVLGLAVPITASYIIAAVMLVPALVKVGIPEPAAHMFMFYYAVLGDVSPPTALAPFAAAALTGGRPFATMRQAWKYTLPAFLVPVMFCVSPTGLRLLMITPQGTAPTSVADFALIAMTSLMAAASLAAFAASLTGYAWRPLTALERAALGIVGLALLWLS
jgi:TRAP transporter 4TM/12TM fusion protein